MKRWLVPVFLGVVVGGCGPEKSSGEAGSGGEASTGGASTSTSGQSTAAGSSTGEPLTTGVSECVCNNDCGNGCTPDPVCDNGAVICDCGNCNESMSESATSGPATSSTGATTGDTTGSGVVCGDVPVFPEFDRSCVEDSDCTLVLHQVDCCGSLVAWGLANDAAKSFAEAEAICQAMYPACDCAPMPTVADDGSSTEDVGTLVVTCKGGSCFSGQL